MKLSLDRGLLFAPAILTVAGRTVHLGNVLIDTGSVSSVFSADLLAAIGVVAQNDDVLYTIRGVGGTETVFVRRADRLDLGGMAVNDFEVELGAMSYGMSMDGIVGLDFLRAVGAILDLEALIMRPKKRRP